jgi:hypothetical protein
MADDRELDALRQQNAELREQLARTTSEAERYRASTNELLDTLFPYKPPTEEELAEMIQPEEGETLQEILAKYSDELAGK